MSADVAERFEASGDLPSTSLALEASAGTGKTWTLTALAVRYIAETDVTLPELLLVTFTRAATAELRERVRVRLSETLAEAERALVDPAWVAKDAVLERIVGDALRHDDGVELRRRRDRLRRAAQQLDEATISTIHGFCQQMLQHAAFEAGVDFDAVLLDDDAELLAEIVDDHIALELRPATPAWVRYLQDCAGVSRERLTHLAREVASLPSLQLLPAHLEDEDGPCWRPWQDALEEFQVAWMDGGRGAAVALIGRLKDDGAFENPRQTTFTAKSAEKYAALVDAWLDEDRSLPPGKVDRKQSEHNPPNYPVAYFTPSALATKLPGDIAAPQHAVLDAAARLVAAASAPATLFLHRAATYIWHELDRRKRQRTVLTFDDLLRRLAAALEDEGARAAVREAIRQRYRVALIDEFQDTDSVQWRIFGALFDTDEPFILIGDPKQAIYAFRGADIHTYVGARDGRPERRTLQTNHRSDERYVEACNVLFGQPGAFATDDIPYHRIDARHPDRLTDPDDRAALQLRYIHRDAGELDERGAGPWWLTKSWANRALPGDVASEVVSLLTDGLSIPDGDHARRALAPQDIAVLVQTNRRADAVQQALRNAGVPAVIQRGGSVFVTEEAEALQRLLAALLRPSAERVAVTAAASVLFGRDAPTLVAQRDALDREVGQDGPPEDHPEAAAATALAQAWDAWADALTRWGERWQRDGILAAVRDAFTQDGVAERLLATPEGERRLTNVRHLIELLHTAETSEGLSPNALLDWLQTHRADAADGDQPSTETELRLEEDAQAVRVVTVHGSKGLQYPVVLCPDLWDGRIRVDEALTRFHDPAVGDPRTAITLDLDVDTTSDGKRRSIELATEQTRTEKLRLAYVALTRAQHRCIVWWGPFKDAPTSSLASLLHGGLQDTPDGRLQRGEDRLGADDADLVDDLEELAAAAPRAIEVQVVQRLGRDAKWEPEPRDTTPLGSRRFDRGDVDRAWRRASFTSLVCGASAHDPGAAGAPEPAGDDARDVDDLPEQNAVDRDGLLLTPVVTSLPADTTQVPLADFPRGAGPGTFIHDVLERADLRAIDDGPVTNGLLEAMERRHGIDPAHRPMVIAGLRAAVTTPLGPVTAGASLADLSPGDRLNELWFELPLAGGHEVGAAAVTLGAIAGLLETSADPVLSEYAPRLRDPALLGSVRGFLIGSIDLLARLPDGRFLVADYKSNWLGNRASGSSVVSDYRPDALTAAMYDHHYVLQALLYLVAAHRYLRWRLPDYSYDTHMAGAGYLFLRGMVGPDTPTIDGQPCGVVALRPDGALVADLSRLLDRGRS
jgi:exodeoxyribonuclease V beta subunit